MLICCRSWHVFLAVELAVVIRSVPALPVMMMPTPTLPVAAMLVAAMPVAVMPAATMPVLEGNDKNFLKSSVQSTFCITWVQAIYFRIVFVSDKDG